MTGRQAFLVAVVGVVLLLAGLVLAATLVWSPLAGLAVALLVTGGVLAWFGLTYDVEE